MTDLPAKKFQVFEVFIFKSFQTLQHLVWILGLKPVTGGVLTTSGSSSSENNSNAVITTAVIADLPVLSSMVTRSDPLLLLLCDFLTLMKWQAI